ALYFIALFWPLWGDMNFLHALVLGVIISVIGYLTDLVVPRAMNNIVAVFLDFALATLVVYLGNYFLPGYYASWTFSLIVGFLVAGVEMFYHPQFIRKSNEPVREDDPKR
ncbi:MAG TPA: DUF2512 family protein, partial [Bacilli bacterium]|nr:DUF2512 family protein [Bacilli bacterium]